MLPTIDCFQFNASPRTPSAWHTTQMEVIRFCNSVFRDVYGRCADAVLAATRERGLATVVELGAGAAPITSRLVRDDRAAHLHFVICDLIPDRKAFADLESRFPGRVTAVYEPVDFSTAAEWGPDALAVLCASAHHVPHRSRSAVFARLVAGTGAVLCFSPVRKTIGSMLAALFVVVPAVLLPVAYAGRPGRWRRVVWCWILPVAPVMMLWDGLGGCLRQWSAADWREAHDTAGIERPLHILETPNSQVVIC